MPQPRRARCRPPSRRFAAGVSKGVLKLNTASRRISRLSKKVNQLAVRPLKGENRGLISR